MRPPLFHYFFLFLYQIVYTILFVLYLPKLLLEMRKKKNVSLIWKRFFPKPISLKKMVTGKEKVFWIHAVSFGETVAVAPLVKELKDLYPDAVFITSHATQTGLEAGLKLLPFAEAHVFLPYDFFFSVRRLMQDVPYITSVIHSEGDMWPCFLTEAKKRGASIIVANGKLSTRSYKRYQYLSYPARWIFSMVDLFCLQTTQFRDRYKALGVSDSKLVVTGNMKADVNIKMLLESEKDDLRRKMCVNSSDILIVLGSTHNPEEKLIIKELEYFLVPPLKIAVVPRHPHRFQEVFQMLQSDFPTKKVVLFSELQNKGAEKDWDILIVDAMGILTSLYQIASLSVVCGSFVSHVGGHNILEPAAVGSPVLVGPYMHSQQWLFDSAAHHHAVIRHKTAHHLAKSLYRLSTHGHVRSQMAQKALQWATDCKGATKRTIDAIHENMKQVQA